MSKKLTGTVAIVTGASSGMPRHRPNPCQPGGLRRPGRAPPRTPRRPDRRDQEQRRRRTGRATDISDRTQAEDAVAQTVERFGRLDILVNNAGLMILGPVTGADVDDWEQMIAINQKGLLSMTKAALPYLHKPAEQGPREVVDISSIAGRVAWANFGVYNMTKFAVKGFTEALHQEITQSHVRVGVLEPGAVDTELVSHNTQEIQTGVPAFPADKQALAPEDIATGSPTWSPDPATPPWASCGSCPPSKPACLSIQGRNTREYTRLGSSGLRVSRIALGCMSFGDGSREKWRSTRF